MQGVKSKFEGSGCGLWSNMLHQNVGRRVYGVWFNRVYGVWFNRVYGVWFNRVHGVWFNAWFACLKNNKCCACGRCKKKSVLHAVGHARAGPCSNSGLGSRV